MITRLAATLRRPDRPPPAERPDPPLTIALNPGYLTERPAALHTERRAALHAERRAALHAERRAALH
ncbi:hypothetical protein ACFWU5_19135, partial [Nocardia sp. NPDC058640]|uniref:hypothetical protein n=1 Tax=Nocardia sp. NPDC058640 TaxID=3346571 RepID=UPI00365B6E41